MPSDPDLLDALNPVPPGKEKLKEIVESAEESLLIIAPWHAAQTDNTELQKVIKTIVKHCKIYVRAIDASIEVADDGYALSDDALRLCKLLLDPNTKRDILQGFIGDMQNQARKALENCRNAMRMFNEVQTGLLEMVKTIPKKAMEGDKSRIARFHNASANPAMKPHIKESPDGKEGDKNRIVRIYHAFAKKLASTFGLKSVDIEVAMNELNLAALKVAKLSESVDNFVNWWAMMETNLKVASEKASDLVPERNKQYRVEIIHDKWAQIRADYLYYKIEIVKLRGFYPEGIEASPQ